MSSQQEPSPIDSALVRLGEGTAQLRDFELFQEAAYNGDYQAQRNFAWWLSGRGTDEQRRRHFQNPIQACAWRMVILASGSSRVDNSDVDNKRVDCESTLNGDALLAAEAQAAKITAVVRTSER